LCTFCQGQLQSSFTHPLLASVRLPLVSSRVSTEFVALDLSASSSPTGAMTHSTASDMDAGFSHIGMASGKLIIKAQLGDDIRKTPINNEDITYDELIVMMGRLFKGKFDAKDDVLLKYRDEDGDLVTIADDSDLKFAIQCNRILKLSIFPDGREPAVVPPIDAQQLSSDLHSLMEQTNHLLESLGRKLREPCESKVTGATSSMASNLSGNVSSTQSSTALHTVPEVHPETNSSPSDSQPNASLTSDASKEFDPLSAEQHQRDDRSRPLTSASNDTDIGSAKSLEGLTLNDRQPATIKPTVQQFQMQPNAPPKPIVSCSIVHLHNQPNDF
jgi:hypothetical protein